MAETGKSRCDMCGAEIAARHLGSVKIGDADVAIGYCERCNVFAVPIGDDDKPYRERMADARGRVPKGWSARQVADGGVELKRGVPRRWMWAFPFCMIVSVASGLVARHYAGIGDMNLEWLVFIAFLVFVAAMFLGFIALCRMTARRYRLGREGLVVESLWLGLLLVCRRKFARTTITNTGIQERGKDFVAVWSNGYDMREFWRGRSKDEADFVDANLCAPDATGAQFAAPLLCEKCGAEFRPDDIDMPNNSLKCPNCGATTEPGSAELARLERYRMRYRPRGVTDIPGGFEYRESAWWSGGVGAALSRAASVLLFVLVALRVVFKLISHEEFIPFILVAVFSVFLVQLLIAAFAGRFGVRRIMKQDGYIIYFHGIGNFGRRVELPLESVCDIGVMYRGSPMDPNAVIPNAIGIVVKGEKKAKRIFRDCPPIFYHWAEGWLRETLKMYSATEAKYGR